MKFCCFRFDADTHVCVSVGIPRLVELGDRLGAKFTFFINMGRAFDPGTTLFKAARRWLTPGGRGSLSVTRKLGPWHALKAAMLNPRAGSSDPTALRSAARSGHEIGLHGGRNHARWERSAHLWTEARLRREIQWGLNQMNRCQLPRPISFASPAWNSPPSLPLVLRSLDFQTLADLYNPFQEEVASLEGLLVFPTNVHPDAGSAGYLETMRLDSRPTREIIAHFRRQLRAKAELAVVYDHPFFAGVHALEQVKAMVEAALDEGFQVATIQAAAHALRPRFGCLEQPSMA